MPDLVLRPVAPAQTRELRQRVLRPHQSLAEVAAGEPTNALAIGAFRDETLVAVGFIAPEATPGLWRLRGMAAEPAVRGQGVGGAVLAALLALAGKRGAERIWCNARVPAVSLYERAGFQRVSGEFPLPDIGPHIRMECRLEAPGRAIRPSLARADHAIRPAGSPGVQS